MRVKKWLVPLLAFIMVWQVAATAQASSNKVIQIFLDGKLLVSDTAPYIKPAEKITMVPARVISEGIGATITPTNKNITIQKDSNTIVLTPGAKTALVNGKEVALDVTVEFVNGRTMLPLRFVSEELGLEVAWNGNDKIITLTSNVGGNNGQNNSGNGSQAKPPATVSGVKPVSEVGVRGVWISTVFNIDWPSQAASGNEEKQKNEYIALLDKLAQSGINTVFVQVRPSADSIYPSSIVPWSNVLTGTSGKAPGYDPLQFIIDETHKRGMEFHAWFNPFRASTGSDTSKLASNHVVNTHPEWIVKYSGKSYINPGIPEARQHIIDAVMEVVNNYNIDGVHMDDYFYPSGETKSNTFGDDNTYAMYNDKNIRNKGDWRRDNISTFVQQLGQKIHAVKPSVSYGVSPFGVWRNKASDPLGSDTKAGMSAYDSTYADVRAWIKNEWIDYVIPQVYWSLSRSEVRYDVITNWWADQVKGTNVKLYIGHAAYKLGTPEIGWNTAQEIINELYYNERLTEVKGSVFFSAKDLMRNTLGLLPLLQSYYESK
ncbi:family 10 glycosylhydrolase [Paenibacillus turicensis]|uniref:family 10 glycosylhydrolase n=1 Tax=Paenibacillus turicensis TaxID=160487 RepID=UPI003D29DB5F